MKFNCSCRFSFPTFFCLILSEEIYSLQHYRDSRLRFSALLDVGNNFPVRCDLLTAQPEKPVEQSRSQKEEEAGCINQETMRDLNQTLTPTDALQTKNTVCYDDLGCITQFSFADPLLWPINLLPEDRGKIGTHFTLYTRENPNPKPPIRIYAGNPNQISATTFNATHETKFLIHGWISTGYSDNDRLLIKRLLMKDDFNVICVHWGGGASAFYFQASANTRLVGLEIALLVNTMVVKLGVKAADVHLIGHSLGAHTAGYAGKKIPSLGRITGLDPAGPYYENMPSYARLDYTDAQFVDVIHTNAGFFGIKEPVGHIDFYPNGGKGQPGCTPFGHSDLKDREGSPTNGSATGNVTVFLASASCDHTRAVQLYSASLRDVCPIVGYECSDYVSFDQGKCISCGAYNTKCARFGLDANNYPSRSRIKVKYYFNTAGNSPYCTSQYLILVQLSRPTRAKAEVTGFFRLSVTGRDAVRTSLLPLSVFEHGKDHPFLLSSPLSLGPIRKVRLTWKYIHSSFFDPTCFLGICNKRLYVNSVTVSLLNGYPQTIGDTYVTCPRCTPAVLRTFQSMEFSVDNSCSSTFRPINSMWNDGPLIVHSR